MLLVQEAADAFFSGDVNVDDLVAASIASPPASAPAAAVDYEVLDSW